MNLISKALLTAKSTPAIFELPKLILGKLQTNIQMPKTRDIRGYESVNASSTTMFSIHTHTQFCVLFQVLANTNRGDRSFVQKIRQ